MLSSSAAEGPREISQCHAMHAEVTHQQGTLVFLLHVNVVVSLSFQTELVY